MPHQDFRYIQTNFHVVFLQIRPPVSKHQPTINFFVHYSPSPYTTESPSAAGIRPHGVRRRGGISGCFPLCSSLAPGRRTAPESCRLPSPVPTLLPDGPAGSRSPTPGERGLQILLPDGKRLLSYP